MQNTTKKYDCIIVSIYIFIVVLTLLHDKSLEHIFGVNFVFSIVLLCIKKKLDDKISKWIFDISKSYLLVLLFIFCFGMFIRFFLR